MRKVGVWLIGAAGSLASTVVTGARAIAHGLAGPTGLVTELPEVRALPLAGLHRLVFAGWEVNSAGILHQARALASDHRALNAGLVAAVEDDLLAVERRVQPGFAAGGGPARPSRGGGGRGPRREPLEHAAARLGDDLQRFREDEHLDTVIVVNVASTEPPISLGPEHARLGSFRRVLQQDRRAMVTPSMLYAYAALDRGCPYINFTPSLGVTPPALQELGETRRVSFFGSDGKTGETLMKTVLAPLFRYRNLEVLSWEGVNLLGGGDGQVLANPRHKASKLRSKGGVLAPSLGYAPHASVAIEYVPSLGNWKTAWDFIHFRGFLDTRMSVQFIWQGCDSILAAPLVLDLVRLAEFAERAGEVGPMTHLACFFKDPLGVRISAFQDQVQLLMDYVERHAADGLKRARRGG
ncbi:MAG: inositol-3-phosphate synthase [Candidatus Rokubacteria bacterium]|nr:inositol-3-phosphate synthase [Candidatus Rokubacteria bacterium]